jgi:hypothetical protein
MQKNRRMKEQNYRNLILLKRAESLREQAFATEIHREPHGYFLDAGWSIDTRNFMINLLNDPHICIAGHPDRNGYRSTGY